MKVLSIGHAVKHNFGHPSTPLRVKEGFIPSGDEVSGQLAIKGDSA
jgi:hypothetical protein